MKTYDEAIIENAQIDTGIENVLSAISQHLAGAYTNIDLEDIKARVKETLDDCVYTAYQENQEIIDEQDAEEARAHKRSESLGSLFV